MRLVRAFSVAAHEYSKYSEMVMRPIRTRKRRDQQESDPDMIERHHQGLCERSGTALTTERIPSGPSLRRHPPDA